MLSVKFCFIWPSWWFQRRRFLEIEHPETRIDYGDNVLLTDLDKMNNLYRGPFHRCFLTKFRFIWPSGFREDFLLIDQPETRIVYVQGHRGRDRIVVGFITTYAISAYHH